MTTSELIRLLQEADPVGDVPVCVSNEDIHWVSRMEAYYDGPLQQLVRERGRVASAKIIRHGSKVKIVTLSVADFLLENPQAPVELIGCDEHRHAQIEQWREAGREFLKSESE